jgi:hypothetical protein
MIPCLSVIMKLTFILTPKRMLKKPSSSAPVALVHFSRLLLFQYLMYNIVKQQHVRLLQGSMQQPAGTLEDRAI